MYDMYQMVTGYRRDNPVLIGSIVTTEINYIIIIIIIIIIFHYFIKTDSVLMSSIL
jgi:hypothetical protein